MIGQDKKKPLITMAAAIGSLLLIAACNSNSGASSYSTGDTTNGSGYYQQTGTGTGTNYPGNNYANSLGWENQAQQNQDSADQNQEDINESNGVGDTVDSGDDGGS